MKRIIVMALGCLWLGFLPMRAEAQSLGSFRWQLQPFCNVVTLTVTEVGAIYRVEGTDDRCGASAKSSVIGTAFMNPDGTIGMGLNVVAAPGGVASPLSAVIALSNLSGEWQSGTGDSGSFTLTPGTGTGGVPRPLPTGSSSIPTVIRLQEDGGLVAGGTLNSGDIPASGLGTRMMWHPRKAAFRAGHLTIPAWDEANVGLYSTAFGLNTVAAGTASVAFGEESLASGVRSASFGFNTQASGENSVAFGDFTIASGIGAVAYGRNSQAIGALSHAAGNNTVASGFASTAMGSSTQAIGAYSIAAGANAVARATGSVAIGNAEVATDATGSFAFGDYSTGVRILADIPGQFKVRASGGVRFATNPTETAGVQLVGGSSQWAQLSDVHSKHLFRDLAGEDVLGKIAALRIAEWSYKAQDSSIRHMGPTAQDFHAAFGLGEDERYIGSLDADGVALAGVKALEERTRALAERNDRLERENDDLRARLARLESRLEKR
jgi:trimeric autotransporter adhesin